MRYLAPCLLLVLVVSLGQAPPALAIPADELLNSLRPAADVNDYAGLLTPQEKAALEARCRQLREKTGAQLAVVTLSSLDGGQIDDFANKLFRRWGIGEKGKNNGLLLIVSMQERKYRLEVGYGLEPIVPDILAARILDQRLRPRFRQMQYAAGLADAVNEICDVVEKGEPADRQALAAERDNGAVVVACLFLSVFVLIGSLVAGIGWGVRTIATVFFGVVFAGIPMLIGLVIASPFAPLIHIPLSIASLFAGRYLGRNPPNISGPGSRGGRRSPTWTWNSPPTGGTWSSGGGGFSTSWGGFGGGSSGGGGASGGW